MAEKYGKKVRELMVGEMEGIFRDNKGFIMASMEKMKASDIDAVRKKIRRAGSRYLVIKNRLAAIALENAGIEGFSDTITEKKILGIGVIKEDPVQIAKLMMEFSRSNKGFQVSKGYVEGRMISADRVRELSELPNREQLISMVMGMLNAPITGFVGVLSSVLRSVLYALNAVKEKKENK
ncbi:MAG: 50S ribosomal protein L10 [Candidatus Omnitrophota bacterium]